MKYVLCFMPPIAVFVYGGFVQALINTVLTLLFYIPGVIHAFVVVIRHENERRHQEKINAIVARSFK